MKKSISLTLKEEILDKLRQEAAKEQRSVSQMLEILASEALDARDKAAK